MPTLHRAVLYASASMLTLVAPAFAQNAEPESLETVVVTGTLIRGTNPTGTNVVGMSTKDIMQSGANSTAQLLQNVTQLMSFNGLQYPAMGGNTGTTNRPNLRSIPGFNTAGGSTTLVLMNGHRIVGMGITSTSPDADIVPSGAISRIEIVPDGGSAIYGSDAVAGVMNFITRKKVDGVEADAHVGVTSNYSSLALNVATGTDWGKGSAYVAYNFEQHTWLRGADRNFVKLFPSTSTDTTLGSNTNLQCSPGNITDLALVAGNKGYIYALGGSSLVAHTANQCDSTKDATLYPKENRHSLMFGVTQELTPWATLEVEGFYTNRVLSAITGPNRTSVNMAPAMLGTTNMAALGYLQSPYTAAHAVYKPYGMASLVSQAVAFQWGASDAQHQNVLLSTWGVLPTLTMTVGGSWQVRVIGSYSESANKSHSYSFNPNALNAAINAGLVNPYDINDPATNTAAAWAAINNWETYGFTHQKYGDLTMIADGDLFDLPAGPVKLAAGVEGSDEHFATINGTQVVGSEYSGSPDLVVNGTKIYDKQPALRNMSARRTVWSLFAELNVPVLADLPGAQELSVSLSGRYDNYSDLSDTFNPKFGLTYKPFQWFKVRGSWGRSFNAPSLADAQTSALTSTSYLPNAYTSFMGPPAALVAAGKYPALAAGQVLMTITGNAPGIHNQVARTVSLGGDISLPWVPNLNLSTTYYRIQLKGQIGMAPYYSASTYWGFYPNFITVNPTQAQIDSAIAISNTPVVNGCSPQPTCVYAIMDGRKNNLGNFKTSGLDIHADYSVDVGFGTIEVGTDGNIELDRQTSAGASGYSDMTGNGYTTYRGRFWLGGTFGNFSTRINFNHTQGYKIDPAVGYVPQKKLDAFDTFDLFTGYDFHGNDLVTRDLAITLNISNVFNTSPPVYRAPPYNNSGALNAGYSGGTLGRLFQIGVSKKF